MPPLSITYEVMIDWDGNDWAGNPTFAGDDDISDDVKIVNWNRGEEREEGNSPASTLELKIKGSLYAKYSVYNTGGDLYGKLLPMKIVRVRAVHNSITYNEFFGYISRITVDPEPNNPSVYIYCTDGMDLLARNLVKQDYQSRTTQTDGASIGDLLDAAGWSASRRDIDVDGGNIFKYPSVSSV